MSLSPPSIQSVISATTPQDPSRSMAIMSVTEGEQKNKSKPSPIVKNTLQTDTEPTVPYIDQTLREIPFTDFFIPVNPPVRVSTVYAGRMPLLSEKDHQM